MKECTFIKFESDGKWGVKNSNENIVIDAQYDDIRPLTRDLFAVKLGDFWGIINADTQTLSFEVEYDDLRYEGGNTIMLCKDGLWGAKDLIPLENDYIGVNIPFEYKDIKPLDPEQTLFGVLKRCDYSDDNTYAIVDEIGNEVFHPTSIHGSIFSSEWPDDEDELLCFDKQFVFFSRDFIVGSIKNKFGVISLNGGHNRYGILTVPFQYDEFQKREDTNFNVQINNKWGILTIEGKEMVSVKYDQPIPNDISNAIVTNAETGRKGVLGDDGREKIPAIFNCIHMDDYFIYAGYCYSGNNSVNRDASPFYYKENNMWSCWSKEGKMLIPAKYEFFDFHNRDNVSEYFVRLSNREDSIDYHTTRFLFAARDGQDGYLCGTNPCLYPPDFRINIYDMYDMNGNLVIGGFESYNLIEEDGFLQIQIDYGDNSGWLILDQNLRSVVANKKGECYQFQKGFVFSRTQHRRIKKVTVVDDEEDVEVQNGEIVGTIDEEDLDWLS